MFNLQDTSLKSEGSTAVFPLGISENNELTSVEKGVSKNEAESIYLKFTFTHADGSKIYRMEFDPGIQAGVAPTEEQKKKVVNINTRVKHILSKFVEPSQFPVADTFEQFVDQTIAVLNGKTAGVKLRIKTTYTWNDYVGIPNYVPFVELQSEQPTKMRIKSIEDGGIDKMVKDNEDSASDVTAQLSAPAAAAPVASSANEPNLPF
jgi:hypothetical protein